MSLSQEYTHARNIRLSQEYAIVRNMLLGKEDACARLCQEHAVESGLCILERNTQHM